MESTSISNDEYPPFQLKKSRFDQSTFFGRWRHFLDVIDPRTLFTTEQQLKDAIQLLDAFKSKQLPPGTTNEQLWRAQKIKQAIIHPDTGEKVFMPFRMSGFVPFGTVPVVGMLLPNPSFKSMIFWQWMNQTHNACVNYANRNATKPTPTSRFIAGYVGAVTSAVSIAVGLSVFIKKANKLNPATRMLIQRFVPFPAVASANVCNVFLMRNSELIEGIEVVDQYERVVGTSKIAARRAIKETALTRVFLPAPLLVIPPIIMTMLEKTRFLKRNPRMHLPVNASVCCFVFGMALPIAIALFPQYTKDYWLNENFRESIHFHCTECKLPTVSVNELEPEFQKLTLEECLYYNKGL